MKRRTFIGALGGAAAWPVVARGQQSERVRRVGVLMALGADDPESKARVTAFVQGLAQLGWIIGQNVQVDYRWALNFDDVHRYVAELVALAPDVILTHSSATVAPLLQATRTVPIVFTLVADPVGAGYVDSLAHPGGNATGFTIHEYAIGAKWLELLKQIAPTVTRVGAAGTGQFGAIQSVASSFGVELNPVGVRDGGDIERAITAFARSSNGGLIVTGSVPASANRELIVALAARHRLPAVYFTRYFVTGGGLISYGPDYVDEFRLAAGYVDRILRGAKPEELPVQAPTKYELVINLKTAKALGIEVPQSLLARADEVIE